MKCIITICLLLLAGSVFAQGKPEAKADSTVQITLSLDQYRAMLQLIDSNIDSKTVTKQLIEFLQKSTRLVQPADKPKEQPEVKDPQKN